MNQVTVDVKERGLGTRSLLQPGLLFVYSDSPSQLRCVPHGFTHRHPGIDGKDFLIGGPHSGQLDDARPDAFIVLVDVEASRSATQVLAPPAAMATAGVAA